MKRSELIAELASAAVSGIPDAHADNRRLNESVFVNMHTVSTPSNIWRGARPTRRSTHNCVLLPNGTPKDVLNNRDLDGDIGSDGSTVHDRAHNAGFIGNVTETMAINWGACGPQLVAMSGDLAASIR